LGEEQNANLRSQARQPKKGQPETSFFIQEKKTGLIFLECPGRQVPVPPSDATQGKKEPAFDGDLQGGEKRRTLGGRGDDN